MIKKTRLIPFGERLTNATQLFFQARCFGLCTMASGIFSGLCAILLAPIAFLRVLFTTRQEYYVEGETRQLPGPQGGGNEGEDWMKEHRKEYGNE